MRFIIMFLLLSLVQLEAQNKLYSLNKTKNIKNPKLNNDLYITCGLKGNIFLINLKNETSKAYDLFIGHQRGIRFIREAKNRQGTWQKIDEYPKFMFCANGLKHINLKVNQYTWEIIPQNNLKGSFATEIRFTYKLNDSLTIYSKPIAYNIQEDLFLSFKLRRLIYLDKLISKADANESKEKLLISQEPQGKHTRHEKGKNSNHFDASIGELNPLVGLNLNYYLIYIKQKRLSIWHRLVVKNFKNQKK